MFIIVPSFQDQTRKALICTFDLSGNFLDRLQEVYLKVANPNFRVDRQIPGAYSLSIVKMNGCEQFFETFVIQDLIGSGCFHDPRYPFCFKADLHMIIPNFHADSTAYQDTKRDQETGLVTVTIQHYSSKAIKNLLIGLIYEPRDLLAKYKRLHFTPAHIKHALLNPANILENFSQLDKSDTLKHIARQINPQPTTHHNTASNWLRPRQSNNPSSHHLQDEHRSSNSNYVFT